MDKTVNITSNKKYKNAQFGVRKSIYKENKIINQIGH